MSPFSDIPGYRMRSVLGEGGFATVYLATQVSLDRDVALKVMDEKLSSDRDFCGRFVREGRDTARLSNHPDIVTIFDIGRIENRYYIAMQYIPGPNLKDLLDASEPYQHPLHIVRRIAGALAYAHQMGFVHRDIKPANILFNESGDAVLSDFGIAKALDRHTRFTDAGQVIGTASYMSPEQARGLPSIDGRSDLYSLGVVFFELLTRKRPYEAPDSMALMLKHVNDPIPRLPESEKAFEPVVHRLMAKDPDDRYVDAQALIDDLDARFFNTSKMPVPPVSVPATQRWSGLIQAGAALCLAGLVAAGVLLWPQDHAGSGSIPAADALPSPDSVPAPDVKPPPTETITESPREPAAQGDSGRNAADQTRIERLSNLAEMHEAVGRLSSPPGANALEAWTLVLELDPDNARARQSIERLQAQ